MLKTNHLKAVFVFYPQTTDSALGDWQQPGMYDSGFAHVAVPGKTELYVILHGARNLPALQDGRQPLPFVAA